MGLLRHQSDSELIVHGDMETGTSINSTGDWRMWTSSEQASPGQLTDAYHGVKSLLSTVKSNDNNIGNIQIFQPIPALAAGYSYFMRAAFRCNSARDVIVSLADGVSSHVDYFTNSIAVGLTWALTEWTITTTIAVSSLSLMFQVGSTGRTSGTGLRIDYVGIFSLGPQVTFLPTYGYKRAKNIQRSDHRTIGGGLYTYIEKGSSTQFKVPMTFVNSEQYGLINSWWRSGATLRWAEDDAYPDSYSTVKIVSKEDPFQTFQAPHFQVYYEGEIVMETV